MKVNTYQCDGCGKQKQNSNHWWRVWKIEGLKAVVITEWDRAPIWQDTTPGSEHAHLCGAECVSQWLSKNLL